MNLQELFYRMRQARAYRDRLLQGAVSGLAGGVGLLTMNGELTGFLNKGPNHPITNLSPKRRLSLGLLSRRVVTDAGVAYMVDDFDNASGGADISNFNFHDCGTGVAAEAVGNTALGTPYGGARSAGTRTQPTAPQYRTAANIAFTSTLAITEHGLFSASSVGTLWDRSVFSAINVVNLDSIDFTYTLTVTSGG